MKREEICKYAEFIELKDWHTIHCEAMNPWNCDGNKFHCLKFKNKYRPRCPINKHNPFL